MTSDHDEPIHTTQPHNYIVPAINDWITKIYLHAKKIIDTRTYHRFHHDYNRQNLLLDENPKLRMIVRFAISTVFKMAFYSREPILFDFVDELIQKMEMSVYINIRDITNIREFEFGLENYGNVNLTHPNIARHTGVVRNPAGDISLFVSC